MALLYKAEVQRGRTWQKVFAERLPEVPFRIWPDVGDPAEIRYLSAWEPLEGMASLLPNLEVVFATGAGVDQFDLARIPASVSLVRLLDPGILAGMEEYVTFATLALHRNIPEYLESQRQHVWKTLPVVSAARRTVGIMGMGQLGQGVLDRLLAFDFRLRGWGRSEHQIAGLQSFVGKEQLKEFLSECDILICLLPLTAETRGILDRRLFDCLPEGAALVNVGRGGHLCEHDLLAALEQGRIRAAVLDVYEPEPLPADHPFWEHPRILLTPHIASVTGLESAARVLIDNIRRHEAGQPMNGLVDRARGY